METDPLPEHLTLLNALIRWCEPTLVEAIRAAERRLTEHEMMGFPHGPALTGKDERRVPTGSGWMAGGTSYVRLMAAWNDCERDLRSQIERSALFLEAVLVTDDYGTEPQALPGAFAAEFRFDFGKNTLGLGKKRYVAVTVSDRPPPWAVVGVPVPAAGSPPGPFRAADLTDEQILALLEEHARRVVENDTPLIAPGRISLMRIIRRKMLHRARTGETRETLGAEARELGEWIAMKVPSHQVPGAGAIENSMRGDYRRLKP